MADNVAITAGSGTSIATDDVAGAHYQKVKLYDSTADSSTGIGTGGGTEAAALRVTLANDSTGVVSVDDNGGSLTVDAPVGTPVFVRLSDGAAAISTLPVSLASVPSHAVTNAGTFATQVDGSALTALQLIDDPVFADDAGFTVGTSKVNMAGLVAVAHGSAPDAADANDAVAALANRHRIPFHLGGHPNIVSTRVTYAASAQTDVSLTGTQNAGTKVVVTQVQVTVSNATTATPSVLIGFGATNTPTGAGVVLSHPGIPGGGGVSRGDGSGILGVGGDGEELRITAGAATGGTLDAVVSYFLIES